MLRVERNGKRFTRLDEPKLVEASITERYDLEEFIFNSPEQFFAEVGEELFVIGKEIPPSEVVQDRIDLLALDQNGKSVIVELKRGNDKLQLLQAVAYAGMVAKWTSGDFLELVNVDRQEQLADFLTVDTEEINREQRIILIAEAYDFEVLVGAEWLHNKYELDILCCRISLAVDPASGAEYLACTPVFPAPELAVQAVPRRRGSVENIRWSSWDQALGNLSNSAIADYYRSQLAADSATKPTGRIAIESSLRYRSLMYRIDGKRRWSIEARDTRAYCWQTGRFEGDIDFWSKRLSNSGSVKPVQRGACLRFFVATSADFAAFHKAVTEELLGAEWTQEPLPAAADDGEEIQPAAQSGK
jgi:hypothetical protein